MQYAYLSGYIYMLVIKENNMNNQNPIEIYQTQDGTTQVEVRFENDTVWLSQAQMAMLFGKDIRTINEHITNIFDDEELEKESTIRKFRIVRQEGKRQVNREIEHYDLDMIISVGYRVKSKQGISFRRWATARLKEYLTQGYTINQKTFTAKCSRIRTSTCAYSKNGKFIRINARKRSRISGYCQPLYAYVFMATTI